jgi:hypothetical protein
VTPSRSQAWRKAFAVYSAALVGVEHHAGHLAAAHRDRHGQRAVGQRRIVPLTRANRQLDSRCRQITGEVFSLAMI